MWLITVKRLAPTAVSNWGTRRIPGANSEQMENGSAGRARWSDSSRRSYILRSVIGLFSGSERFWREIYGTVSPETGRRQYRSAYISVGKQNGKSFLIAGLPIYHLLMENERNPEVYGCAAAKDQAGLVFKAAVQLVNANSVLRHKLKVLESTRRIIRQDGGGFYAVVSADGDLQDGVRASLVIRDEVHRWKTQRAETLRDVIVKGQISREEPLNIGISTAGAEFESRLWWQEYQQAKKVIDGSIPIGFILRRDLGGGCQAHR